MRRNKIIADAIIISVYCDIVLAILKDHKSLSLNKTITFAYLIKKQKFSYKSIYNAKTSNDVLLKSLSALSGAFEDYCDNVEYIIKSIHLLIENKRITLNESELYDNNYIESKNICKINKFTNKSIQEGKKVTDRQFLKEVIKHV